MQTESYLNELKVFAALSGKQKLSFRVQMMFVPAFHFVHVDHWHPLLNLVALQRINADTGFFRVY